MTANTKKRIESIDVLRGIVMVIMALDHVRDFFHIESWTDNPLNLATTTPLLFGTRYITHFCAPIFVFLSGTSVHLQSLRKSKQELFSFLLKRGLWLIFIEVAVVTFGITFQFDYSFVLLQVIWAIGISMIILAFLIKLPYKYVLLVGLIIVLGHNLLDIHESAPGFKAGFWWELLHHGRLATFPFAPGHVIAILYPFVPWTGLMILGYCFGIFFTAKYTPEHRNRLFVRIGLGMLFVFVVLRSGNFYGNPQPWTFQKNALFTFFSFINIQKYPASLLFMCITIGVAILVLPSLEKVKNRVTEIFKTYGRVAFFYYIIHWYVVHTLLMLYFFNNGHTEAEAKMYVKEIPFKYAVAGEGVSLGWVYVIWLFVVIALYPLCKWYDGYKTAHPEKKWLSYL